MLLSPQVLPKVTIEPKGTQHFLMLTLLLHCSALTQKAGRGASPPWARAVPSRARSVTASWACPAAGGWEASHTALASCPGNASAQWEAGPWRGPWGLPAQRGGGVEGATPRPATLGLRAVGAPPASHLLGADSPAAPRRGPRLSPADAEGALLSAAEHPAQRGQGAGKPVDGLTAWSRRGDAGAPLPLTPRRPPENTAAG